MGSIKAQKMALKVSESVRNNTNTTYGEIARDVGYSKTSSLKPQRITRSKSYKIALIAENAPLLEGLQKEINAIKNAMAMKDKTHEDYKVLAYAMDTLTKNYQLLSGGATERQVFVLPSEVIQKNVIVTDEQKQLPENGSTEP